MVKACCGKMRQARRGTLSNDRARMGLGRKAGEVRQGSEEQVREGRVEVRCGRRGWERYGLAGLDEAWPVLAGMVGRGVDGVAGSGRVQQAWLGVVWCGGSGRIRQGSAGTESRGLFRYGRARRVQAGEAIGMEGRVTTGFGEYRQEWSDGVSRVTVWTGV